MSSVRFLVDTSAAIRMTRYDEVRSEWSPEIRGGRLGVCSAAELEVFYTARSKADRSDLRADLDEAFAWVPMPERVFERAPEIQFGLTERGTHRSAGPTDLLIAATAEHNGLTLLHYDADFEAVSAVTGQPVRWVTEPGSVS